MKKLIKIASILVVLATITSQHAFAAEVATSAELASVNGMGCDCVINGGPCQTARKGDCTFKFEGAECDLHVSGPETIWTCQASTAQTNFCTPKQPRPCRMVKEGTCKESRVQIPGSPITIVVCDAGSPVPKGSAPDADGVPCM